jgi:DNA polymerase/3'-5' exonuclease PolX
MATNSIQRENGEYGIIILGNVGVEKTYICNLLIGHRKFVSAYEPEAVTTATESYRIATASGNLLIYNIPGLIETNQERIDRNKREIMKAFDLSPISIVMFVTSAAIGGRI